MEDLARIKLNVQSMAEQGAPMEDMDGYIASEGVSIDDVKEYELQEADYLEFGTGHKVARNLMDIPTFGMGDEISSAVGAAIAAPFTNQELTVQRAQEGVEEEDWYKSATAMAPSFIKNFEEAQAIQHQNKQEFGEEHPKTAIASELAGIVPAVMTGGAAFSGATKSLQNASPALQRLVQSISNAGARSKPLRYLTTGARNSGAGGVQGGLYSFGSSNGGTGERLQDAKTGGLLASGAGLVSPVISLPVRKLGQYTPKPLKKAYESLADKATRLFGSKADDAAAIALRNSDDVVAEQTSDLNPKAISKVKEKLIKDFSSPEEFEAALLKASRNPDIAIADLGGKNVSNLAMGSAQYPSGAPKAEEFISKRLAGVPDRIKASLSKNVHSSPEYFSTLDDIVLKGREKAAPLYAKAYSKQVTPTRELGALLQRPALQTASKKAAKIAADEGVDLTKVNDFRVFDYTKRGLDDVLDGYRDKTTGKLVLDERGRAIEKLRSEYVKELKKMNPSYGKALAESGDYLSVRNAAEQGRKFLRSDPDLMKDMYAKFTNREKDAYKMGIVKSIRDKIDSGGDNSNLFNRIGANKEVLRKRLAFILSPKEYRGLMDDLGAEEQLYKFKNQVLGNSTTVSKAMAAKDISSEAMEVAQIVGTSGLSQVPKLSMSRVIRGAFSGLSDKKATKIADALYETDPTKKLLLLQSLSGKQQFARQIAKNPEAKKVIEAYYQMERLIRDSKTKWAIALGAAIAPDYTPEYVTDNEGKMYNYKEDE